MLTFERAHRFYMHTMRHLHEVIIAAVVEGERHTIILMLGFTGVMLLVFAVQVALAAEEA